MDIAITILKALLVAILGSGSILFAGVAGMAASDGDRAATRRGVLLAYAGVIGAAIVAVLPL